MKNKALVLGFSFLGLLCSCSSVAKSNPEIGYQKYKDSQITYMKSIGGTGKEVAFNSCNYAYITGDGSSEAGSLIGTVWYYAKCTLTVNSGSKNYVDYFFYEPEGDAIHTCDSKSYQDAVHLVSQGALSGKVGTL